VPTFGRNQICNADMGTALRAFAQSTARKRGARPHGFHFLTREPQRSIRLQVRLNRNSRESALASPVSGGSLQTRKDADADRDYNKADDGDLITVHADDLSIEQLTVRLELETPLTEASPSLTSSRCRLGPRASSPRC
jgi:hypothetical protein